MAKFSQLSLLCSQPELQGGPVQQQPLLLEGLTRWQAVPGLSEALLQCPDPSALVVSHAWITASFCTRDRKAMTWVPLFNQRFATPGDGTALSPLTIKEILNLHPVQKSQFHAAIQVGLSQTGLPPPAPDQDQIKHKDTPDTEHEGAGTSEEGWEELLGLLSSWYGRGLDALRRSRHLSHDPM